MGAGVLDAENGAGVDLPPNAAPDAAEGNGALKIGGLPHRRQAVGAEEGAAAVAQKSGADGDSTPLGRRCRCCRGCFWAPQAPESGPLGNRTA